MIRKLVEQGMNVARINFSHGSYEEHAQVIEYIKEIRVELSKPIGIMLDTKGPEIRIGNIEPRKVSPSDIVRIGEEIPILPSFIVDEVLVGSKIFFDDGYIHGKVVRKGKGFAEVEILNEGTLQKNKGVNIPDQVFDLPDLTEKDIADIRFGCGRGIDMIAASFIRSAKQVLAIKELIAKEKAPHLLVIAKIENREGVKNFEEIVQVADGIMVARGDLGIEISVTHLPPLQKKMIRECNLRAKPVIIATQMLESMIKNPMPTRAEASDVANAIYDSASAVMLSGETAVGAYPLQAVKMMHEIASEAERDFDYKAFFHKMMENELFDVPSGVARAAINTCYNIKATAIIACSNSGSTIRRICCCRPKARIIAVTPSYKTYYQTSIMWGAEGYIEKHTDIEKGFDDIACHSLSSGWVDYGDLVVVTMGKPYGISFTTNTLFVESVGKVLVRGQKLESEILPFEGEITIFYSGENKNFKDKIVVLTKVLDSELHNLTQAKAIILQNHPLDHHSEEKLAKLYGEYNIPYIARADGATFLLKEGATVRVEPTLGLVFKGGSLTKSEMLAVHRDAQK